MALGKGKSWQSHRKGPHAADLMGIEHLVPKLSATPALNNILPSLWKTWRRSRAAQAWPWSWIFAQQHLQSPESKEVIEETSQAIAWGRRGWASRQMVARMCETQWWRSERAAKAAT